MRQFGSVYEVTTDGKLIIECSSDIPEIGESVFDKKENKLGTVKRVFGPVDAPFVSVQTVPGMAPEKLRGAELFIKGGRESAKTKGRSRRN